MITSFDPTLPREEIKVARLTKNQDAFTGKELPSQDAREKLLRIQPIEVNNDRRQWAQPKGFEAGGQEEELWKAEADQCTKRQAGA